jgi:hypothetical protein
MRNSALILLSVVLPLLAALPADAGNKSGRMITTCSEYGNGCYTGPVRQGRYGPMIRLKGGTWIDCRGDCRQAVREESLDFWETQNDKAIIGTP